MENLNNKFTFNDEPTNTSNHLPTKHSEIKNDETNNSLLTQDFIIQNVPLITAEKAFSINLKNGPYFTKYLRNGRHIILRNGKGFVSSFDVKSYNLNFELNLEEEIFDSCFLHNERFVAVAQKDNVFVYSNQGVELHCCRGFKSTIKLEFLEYHFLLAMLSKNGYLNYQDTSIGKFIAEIPLKEKYHIMTQNKSNAIIYLGTNKGTVSTFTPNSKEYLTKIFCSKGNLNGICIDNSGRYLITAGTEKDVRIFDIRNTYKPFNTIKPILAAKNISLSDNNCLSVNFGKEIHIYKNIFEDPSLFLKHREPINISNLDFCPYEDILTIGTQNGMKNLIVPGSGNSKYDCNENSPFLSRKEKAELEVKKLLEKIPYTFIGQDSLFNLKKEDKKIEIKDRYYK